MVNNTRTICVFTLRNDLSLKETLLPFSVFTRKTKGVHVSNEADQWFQKYLNIPGCQLFCLPSDGVPRYVPKEKVPQEDYVSHPVRANQLIQES